MITEKEKGKRGIRRKGEGQKEKEERKKHPRRGRLRKRSNARPHAYENTTMIRNLNLIEALGHL